MWEEDRTARNILFDKIMAVFGNPLPYCEPNWYSSNYRSPYYSETHRLWRSRCRKFVDEKIMPHVSDWEKNKEIPKHVYKEAYQAGLIPCVVGAKGFEYVDCEKPKDYDYFHLRKFLSGKKFSCCNGFLL